MTELTAQAQSYLQEPGKVTVLATADGEGKTNLARVGSVSTGDGASVRCMLGDNRSYRNLQANPNAALLVMRPGSSGMQTEGCRLYLRLGSSCDQGAEFDTMKAAIRERAGKAADMLQHLLTFEVLEVRPIIDTGA